MKRIEGLLREYWYLNKESKRMMLDLSLAQHSYEQSASSLPSSCRYSVVKTRSRQNAKPVEISAMIMIDEYRAQVESIERRLRQAKNKIEDIERLVEGAGLSSREATYVRLRYFKNLSAEAVAQRLFCSVSTCRRIRIIALEKIKQEIEKPTLEGRLYESN